MKKLEPSSPIKFTLDGKEVIIHPSEVLIVEDPLAELYYISHNHGVVSDYCAQIKAVRDAQKNLLKAEMAKTYLRMKGGTYEKTYGGRVTEDAVENAVSDTVSVQQLEQSIVEWNCVLDRLYDLKDEIKMKLEALKEIVQTTRVDMKINAKSPV